MTLIPVFLNGFFKGRKIMLSFSPQSKLSIFPIFHRGILPLMEHSLSEGNPDPTKPPTPQFSNIPIYFYKLFKLFKTEHI
jgi:hypothetical protein